MDPLIALQNINAICRAYSCNADQRDIVNQSLQTLKECVELALKVTAPTVIASPLSVGEATTHTDVLGPNPSKVELDKFD